MNHLIADEAMAARLRNVSEPVEIRDSAEKVLGLFTPALPAVRQVQTEELFDLEEAERILTTERHLGRPLAEIWRDLHTKENAK